MPSVREDQLSDASCDFIVKIQSQVDNQIDLEIKDASVRRKERRLTVPDVVPILPESEHISEDEYLNTDPTYATNTIGHTENIPARQSVSRHVREKSIQQAIRTISDDVDEERIFSFGPFRQQHCLHYGDAVPHIHDENTSHNNIGGNESAKDSSSSHSHSTYREIDGRKLRDYRDSTYISGSMVRRKKRAKCHPSIHNEYGNFCETVHMFAGTNQNSEMNLINATNEDDNSNLKSYSLCDLLKQHPEKSLITANICSKLNHFFVSPVGQEILKIVSERNFSRSGFSFLENLLTSVSISDVKTIKESVDWMWKILQEQEIKANMVQCSKGITKELSGETDILGTRCTGCKCIEKNTIYSSSSSSCALPPRTLKLFRKRKSWQSRQLHTDNPHLIKTTRMKEQLAVNKNNGQNCAFVMNTSKDTRTIKCDSNPIHTPVFNKNMSKGGKTKKHSINTANKTNTIKNQVKGLLCVIKDKFKFESQKVFNINTKEKPDTSIQLQDDMSNKSKDEIVVKDRNLPDEFGTSMCNDELSVIRLDTEITSNKSKFHYYEKVNEPFPGGYAPISSNITPPFWHTFKFDNQKAMSASDAISNNNVSIEEKENQTSSTEPLSVVVSKIVEKFCATIKTKDLYDISAILDQLLQYQRQKIQTGGNIRTKTSKMKTKTSKKLYERGKNKSKEGKYWYAGFSGQAGRTEIKYAADNRANSKEEAQIYQISGNISDVQLVRNSLNIDSNALRHQATSESSKYCRQTPLSKSVETQSRHTNNSQDIQCLVSSDVNYLNKNFEKNPLKPLRGTGHRREENHLQNLSNITYHSKSKNIRNNVTKEEEEEKSKIENNRIILQNRGIYCRRKKKTKRLNEKENHSEQSSVCSLPDTRRQARKYPVSDDDDIVDDVYNEQITTTLKCNSGKEENAISSLQKGNMLYSYGSFTPVRRGNIEFHTTKCENQNCIHEEYKAPCSTQLPNSMNKTSNYENVLYKSATFESENISEQKAKKVYEIKLRHDELPYNIDTRLRSQAAATCQAEEPHSTDCLVESVGSEKKCFDRYQGIKSSCICDQHNYLSTTCNHNVSVDETLVSMDNSIDISVSRPINSDGNSVQNGRVSSTHYFSNWLLKTNQNNEKFTCENKNSETFLVQNRSSSYKHRNDKPGDFLEAQNFSGCFTNMNKEWTENEEYVQDNVSENTRKERSEHSKYVEDDTVIPHHSFDIALCPYTNSTQISESLEQCSFLPSFTGNREYSSTSHSVCSILRTVIVKQPLCQRPPSVDEKETPCSGFLASCYGDFWWKDKVKTFRADNLFSKSIYCPQYSKILQVIPCLFTPPKNIKQSGSLIVMNNHFHDTVDNEAHIEFNCRNSEDDEEEMSSFEFSIEAGYFAAENDKNLEPLCTDQNSDEGAAKDVTEVSSAVCEIMKSLSEENSDYKICTIKLSEEQTVSINTEIRSESNESFEKRSDILNASSNETEIDSDEGSVMNATGCSFEMLESGGSNAIMNNKQYFTKADEMFAICRPQEASKQVNEQRETDIDLTHAEAVEWTSTVKTFFRENRTELRSVNEYEVISSSDSSTSVQKVTDCEEDDDTVNGHIKASEENTSNVCMDRVNEQLCSNETDGKNKQQVSDLSVPIHDTLKTQYYAMGDGDFCKQNKYITADQIIMRFSVPDNIHEKKHNKKNELSKHKATQLKHKNDGKDKKIVSNDICGILLPSLLRTTESRKLFKSPTAISENEFEGKNQTFTVFVAQDDESNISEINTVEKEDTDFLKELPYKSINQDLERKKCKKRKKNSEVHSSIIDIKGSSKHANKSENFVAFTDLPVDAESGPVISTDNSTPIVIQKEYNGVKVTIEDTTGKIFNNETLFQNISKVLYATTTDSKFIDETKYFTSFKKDSKNGVANTEAGIKGRPVEKSVFSIKPALFYNCEESQDIEHNSATKNYVQANASGKKIKVEKLRNELKGESDFTIQHTPEEFTSLKQTGALQNKKNNVEIIKDVRKDLPHKLTSSKNLSKKSTRNHLSPATATLFEAPTIAVKRRNQIHAKKNFELSQTLEDDYSRCISVPDDMPKNHLNSASEPLSLHRTPPLKVSKNSLQMLNDEENVNTKFYTDGQMVFIDKESFINATLSGRDYNWKNYESPPDFYADSSVSQSSSEFLSEGFPALQVEKDQKSKEISNRLNKLDPVNQVGNSKLSDYQSSSDNNGDEKSQNFVYPLIELHSSNHTYLVDENRNSSQSSSTEQEVDMKSFTTAGMEIWKNANFPDQEHIFHDQEPLTGSGHVKQYQNNSTHSSSITDTEDKFFNDNIKHEISKIFSNSVETQTSKERLINISAGTGYGKKQLENQFTCYEPTAKEHNMSFNQNTENSDTMMQHFSIVKDYIKSSTENLNAEKGKLEKNLSSETVSDSGYQLQMTDKKFTYSRLNDKDSSTSISKATDIPLISVSSISEPDAELKLALPSHKSNSVSSLQQIHVVLQIGGEETLEKQYFPSPKKLESIVKDTASPTCTSEEKEIADIPVMKGKQKISLKGSFTGHKQKCDKLRKHGSDKSVRQITGITNEELTASSEKIKKGKNKVSMFFSKLINSKSNSEIDPILKSNYSNIGEEDRVLIVGYEENQDEEKQVKFLERGAKKSPDEMKWLKSMENTSAVRNMSQESQSLEKIKGTELKKNVRKHNFEREGKVQSTKIWNYLTPVELLMYFRRGFRKDQMTLNKKACFIERADRIDTAAIENENVIDITGRCLPLNFLSKLGYSVEEAAIILQDEEHKARLNAAIQEAKIWVNSVTKSQGALLYLLSCNAKPKIMRHFLYVVEAIVNRRIINAVKLNGVIKVLEQLEDKEISLVEIFGSELVPDTEAVEKQKLQELYKNLYSMTENEAISAGKYPLSERTVYLVKYLAAKFHPKLEQHSAILTQYIGQGLITKLIQIEAAMLYLRALEDETVNIAEFEEYCEIRR